MAKPRTWDSLRFFRKDSPIDNWGDPDAIADYLLLRLDDFRRHIGVPIYVLHGTGGVHSAASYHYVKNGACAVDIAIPEYPLTPIDLLIDVFRFDFTGVGFYPDWKFRGQKAKGLHLDCRPLMWDSDKTKNFRENRWMGVRNPEGKQIYLPLNFENVDKYTRGNSWNS